MEKEDSIKALSDLVQLDIDTVHAYDQAVGQIDDPIIRDRMLGFQSSHQHRIGALAAKIESMGGQPSDHTKDVKGYVMETFTAIFTRLQSSEGELPHSSATPSRGFSVKMWRRSVLPPMWPTTKCSTTDASSNRNRSSPTPLQ
jgi:hypothetical protein